MKTVLITRPQEDAEQLADLLALRGMRSLAEPLLHIEYMPKNKPLLNSALSRRPQLILITSKNALKALAEFSDSRAIPLFCVGEATAQLAANLGFTVRSHGNTAQDLVQRITTQCSTDSSLLYLRGEDIRFDLSAELGKRDFRIDSVTLYRAVAAHHFSEKLQRLIVEGELAGTMFFSQRTAETYVQLAEKHGLRASHRILQAVCMSEPVARVLKTLPWHGIHVSGKPDMAHMIKAVEDAF